MENTSFLFEAIEPKTLLSQVDKIDKSLLLIVSFIEDCCIVSLNECELNKTLYQQYAIWCEQCSIMPLGKKRFGSKLVQLGLHAENTGFGYYRMGICLKKEDTMKAEKLTDLNDLIAYVKHHDLKQYEE